MSTAVRPAQLRAARPFCGRSCGPDSWRHWQVCRVQPGGRAAARRTRRSSARQRWRGSWSSSASLPSPGISADLVRLAAAQSSRDPHPRAGRSCFPSHPTSHCLRGFRRAPPALARLSGPSRPRPQRRPPSSGPEGRAPPRRRRQQRGHLRHRNQRDRPPRPRPHHRRWHRRPSPRRSHPHHRRLSPRPPRPEFARVPAPSSAAGGVAFTRASNASRRRRRPRAIVPRRGCAPRCRHCAPPTRGLCPAGAHAGGRPTPVSPTTRQPRASRALP